MIIELTGPSGSGKSTLLKELIKTFYENGKKVYVIGSVYNDKKSINEFTTPELQNWKTDIRTILPFSKNIIKNPKLFIKLIICLLKVKKDRLTIFRSIIRKIGIHQIYKSKNSKDSIIIIDEGEFHIVHNLFVNEYERPDLEQALSIAKELKNSDLTVLLMSPVKELKERLFKRGDLSTRITNKKGFDEFTLNSHRVYNFLINNLKRKSLLCYDTSKISNRTISNELIRKSLKSSKIRSLK